MQRSASDAGETRWSVHAEAPSVRELLASGEVLTAVRSEGEVTSTQDVALALATDGMPGGTLVIADRQLAGRGRAGRRWDDRPDGGTLAATLLLDVDGFEAVVLPLVPHALGVAVARACAAATAPNAGAPPIRLKWPNDVIVRVGTDGAVRKLSGVLVERERSVGPSGPRDVLLCGVGLDVDLRGGGEASDRICLATLLGEVPDRAALLRALVGALDAALVTLRDDPAALLDQYRALSDTVGRRVRVAPHGAVAGAGAGAGSGIGDVVVGTATAIDEHGRLCVTMGGRSHAILSGTVRDDDGRHDGWREEQA